MANVQIQVEDARAAEAIWQLLIHQEHDDRDQPLVAAAEVQERTTGRRHCISYDPAAYSWSCARI